MNGAHVDGAPLDAQVGERCRKMREKRGLGLKQVAPLVRLDHGALSRMERGERPISRQLVRDLARFYGCSAFHLEFGVPELVWVFWRQNDTGQVDMIAGFTDQAEADEWRETAETALDSEYDTFHVEPIALDDTETMRLFAEERLVSHIETKEVTA